MTFLKRHLNLALIVEGILISLFFLNACIEKPEPEKYVARVNDSYLDESELVDLSDTIAVSREEKLKIIRSWVEKELLYQQAEREGILNKEEFRKTIEDSKKQLAAALLLNKIASEKTYNISDSELENYYNKNRNNFSLTSTYYLLNRVKFSSYESALQFRSSLTTTDWNLALKSFQNDSSLSTSWNDSFLGEYEIYPKHVLRVLQGLYPLEISIVISDEPGYYTVLEVLDIFNPGSIPPFEVIKPKVEKRLTAELEKISIEKYIEELYLNNKIEVNY